ncbi:MAG: relaxase, partial [Rhodobiaceae bacterium]|nr:relaxase [Rhodobiaceae bacterium]
MILKGSQRGGAAQLAAHLMNDRDNDHVTLHQSRGFIADTLPEALDEAHAISKATKCKQYL